MCFNRKAVSIIYLSRLSVIKTRKNVGVEEVREHSLEKMDFVPEKGNKGIFQVGPTA